MKYIKISRRLLNNKLSISYINGFTTGYCFGVGASLIMGMIIK